MYCEKCGKKLNEQGICLKCSGVQEKEKMSTGKLTILLVAVSSIGLVASFWLGELAWKLTETKTYHKFSEKSDFRVDLGLDGYHTVEHNDTVAYCVLLICILITMGIDIYIYRKNKKR